MGSPEVDEAVKQLAKLDPVMGAHIKRVGPCAMKPRAGGGSHFEHLARAITYQQLAGRAAATIWGRVRALVNGRFTPEALLELSDAELRGAGLSQNKMLSMRDLAQHVVDRRLPLSRLSRQSDEQIIAELIQVRGIGRWTAEMFLMSQLARLDVWPVADLGVRSGYRILYDLDELPSVAELSAAGAKFAPYRSIAAWYCWRAVDVINPVDVARSNNK